ncbi:MAG: IS1634 family transposase [Candidatus Paceibacteria bacterium]
MYIRKLKNRSGSISIQIISKVKGRYKVVKTIGCATQQHKIKQLESQAKQELKKITQQGQMTLFKSESDELVRSIFQSLRNSSIHTIGPELIFGKIFDFIGLDQIKDKMFRHLVIARLAFPLSKLKTIEYLYRYQGVTLEISAVYRFLDKLSDKYKEKAEQIVFEHTKKVLGGEVGVVFYDMTTLYFEASDEDDLRKSGFSKDGKHQNPQIFLGLLVAKKGYVIGYDIYKGNTYEGDTLIPFIEKIASKFKLDKPIVIADSGLLSKKNIEALRAVGYEYILGARIRNESEKIKTHILENYYADGDTVSIQKDKSNRIIISYSSKRAKKDAYNRERGLRCLEKRIKTGRLTKSSINNRGYNKYLKLEGEVNIEIDYSKLEQDKYWDGLKGYITNTKLTDEEVIANYGELWHIEKAFRISKTDLRIRPIYHRLRNRIEAHICISFTAYSIYKELERALYMAKSSLSVKEASELTHNMYQITYRLPDSKTSETQLLEMDEQQRKLYEIVNNFSRVLQ